MQLLPQASGAEGKYKFFSATKRISVEYGAAAVECVHRPRQRDLHEQSKSRGSAIGKEKRIIT